MELFVGVYPGAIGLGIGVLAIVVTFFPPAKRGWKHAVLAIFGVLTLTAIAATFASQYLAYQDKLARQTADSERDQRLEYMKGQLDAMVRLGAPQEETKRVELVADAFKTIIAAVGGSHQDSGEVQAALSNLQTQLKQLEPSYALVRSDGVVTEVRNFDQYGMAVEKREETRSDGAAWNVYILTFKHEPERFSVRTDDGATPFRNPIGPQQYRVGFVGVGFGDPVVDANFRVEVR
jgi:hypothetical protein